MEPRINVVTLGVRDIDRAVRFYRDGLGWRPAVEKGDFVLFEAGGVALALYPRDLLAEDAGMTPGRRNRCPRLSSSGVPGAAR